MKAQKARRYAIHACQKTRFRMSFVRTNRENQVNFVANFPYIDAFWMPSACLVRCCRVFRHAHLGSMIKRFGDEKYMMNSSIRPDAECAFWESTRTLASRRHSIFLASDRMTRPPALKKSMNALRTDAEDHAGFRYRQMPFVDHLIYQANQRDAHAVVADGIIV